jgi:hypothetical protein
MGAWLIPIVVTVAGTIAGHILAKSSEGSSWFGPDDAPSETTQMQHQVRLWVGMQKVRPGDSGEPDHGLAGTTPDMHLWGERGELLADKYALEFIGEGERRDYWIGGDSNQKPGYGEYTSMSTLTLGCKHRLTATTVSETLWAATNPL